jgi:hypothetical protein
VSTIVRRRRSSKLQLGPYKRHELLTGEVKIVVQGYSGYSDQIHTDLTLFIGPEMRADWANHCAELIEFWRSGQSSVIFPDCLPWLFITRGSTNTPCWAERHLDQPPA